MNFIATVNAPSHGQIAVTFSDIEKRVLGAWTIPDNAGASYTVDLSPEENRQISSDIICNRRHKRIFEKAYVATSAFGIFIFPVRSGRFCQSKLIEFATQIAIWIKTESSIRMSENEAMGQGMCIANDAIKFKNVIYEAGLDIWKVKCGVYAKDTGASNRIHILTGK